MIENSMVLSACQHQIIVQLHPRAEGLGSVAQSVLAFSEDGWLTGANRKGLALLKLRTKTSRQPAGRIYSRQNFNRYCHFTSAQ
jgi:sensor histidine kinase regulating citrate/malate metabolism